jgi:exopolysaccharide production protein ExoZ
MPSSRRYYTLLNQLRGVAAMLVVWSHIVGDEMQRDGRTWFGLTIVKRFITGPLDIVQQFGWFGVVLFFLISGFVITDAAYRETSREFVVRRLLRIYPPIIMTTIIILVLASFGAEPALANVSPIAWILSVTLVNYIIVPQALVIGVAWTLAIEVTFYLVIWLVSPLGKRAPWLFPAITLIVIAVVRVFDDKLGNSFFLLSVCTGYLPILVLGQLVFLVVSKRIPRWAGALGVLAAWGIFIWCLERNYPAFLLPINSYGPSITIAAAVFLGAIVAEGRLRPLGLLDVVARRSYTLYLVHGPIGFLLVDVLSPVAWMPSTVVLLIALLGIAAATELAYRLVEKPSLQLNRRVFRRSKAVQPADLRASSATTTPVSDVP